MFLEIYCIIRYKNRRDTLIGGHNYMKNYNLKTPYDSYLESLERIKKSLMPLSKTFTTIAFDTAALTGAAELMNNRIADIWKGYETIDLSKVMPSVLPDAYKPLGLSDYCQKSISSIIQVSKQISSVNMAEISTEKFEKIAKSLMSVSPRNTTCTIQSLQESIRLFTEGIISEQIGQLRSIDYAKIFSETLESNGSFSDAVNAAYDSIQEKKIVTEERELETDFVNEQEIQDAIDDQINNPDGFQARIANWASEKYKKYYIAINFLLLIWGIFLQPYLQENVGLPVMTYVVSNVKELPQKGAKIVAQLKENVEATIIENTNYYYKITFTDENGIQREGYVAKRNLKLIEESETEEDSLPEK